MHNLETGDWSNAEEVVLDDAHSNLDVMFADDAMGLFCWHVMGGTLSYAADLIPEISDDAVNIDRAMRWGFNWKQGPFEMLDALDPARFIKRLEADGLNMPKMLGIMGNAGVETFYRNDGREFLGRDGNYYPIPAE